MRRRAVNRASAFDIDAKMAPRKEDGYELRQPRYSDRSNSNLALDPALEDAYKSDSDDEELEDVDEFDPLNYDAGTLKRKKEQRRRRTEDAEPLLAVSPRRRAGWRRWLIPSKFCCSLILLFFTVVLLLLATGGYWAYKAGAPAQGQSPPWYPSPLGGTDKLWEESYRKAAALVSQMTLVEKVNVTTGTGWGMDMCVGNTGLIERLGFPSLCLQDGPLGIRFADNVTAFPAGITIGSTWNKDLMYQRGKAHGSEAKAKGINVLLGPSMGPLGRTPMGGRNWEGFGADPVLQGLAAAQTIRGIQSEGVMATAKHLIGNEQEHFRQSWEWVRPNAISSNIDDRTLHELYGWPFAESVRAGVTSVMCSYNQINNSYACGNSKLMNGILKDELGFQGFVQSDWLAQRSGVGSALAGLDMSMPGDGLRWMDGVALWGGELTKAVMNGSVPVERLNDMATRIVAAWYQMGQDDKSKWPMPADGGGPNFSSWTNDAKGKLHPESDDKTEGIVNKFVNPRANHSELARKIAAEGIVLVKNDDHVLPLSADGWHDKPANDSRKYRVTVFGEDAVLNPDGINACADRGCSMGTLASGWGSGAVDFPYIIEPLAALKGAFNNETVDLKSYAANNAARNEQAKKMAMDSDLCIAFVMANSGEGYIAYGDLKADRNDLLLQKGGDIMAHNIAKLCGNGTSDTIIVIHSVGPVLVENFVGLPNVKAILFANLPGQESGNSLVDVLFGHINPSGRLPYTVGKTEEDYGPAAQILRHTTEMIPQQNFTEGIFIDYRHFDYHNITPRYEFGYGLSYTKFHLNSLMINPKTLTKTPLPKPRPDTPDVQPPTYDTTLPDPSTLLFPKGWRKLHKYIYPYLDSVSSISKKSPPQYPPGTGPTNPHPLSQAGGGPGGNPDLYTPMVEVTATLANTGKVAGSCVVQLYISMPQNYTDSETGEVLVFPPRQLRAFEKYEMGKGSERAHISMTLTRKDLSYWSTVRQNWVMPTDRDIGIEVGFSSRDLPLKGSF